MDANIPYTYTIYERINRVEALACPATLSLQAFTKRLNSECRRQHSNINLLRKWPDTLVLALAFSFQSFHNCRCRCCICCCSWYMHVSSRQVVPAANVAVFPHQTCTYMQLCLHKCVCVFPSLTQNIFSPTQLPTNRHSLRNVAYCIGIIENNKKAPKIQPFKRALSVRYFNNNNNHATMSTTTVLSVFLFSLYEL